MTGGVGIVRACGRASASVQKLLRRQEQTHVVDRELVGVLSCRLVLKQREQQLLAKRRVGVDEQRPRRVNHVHCVHVLHQSQFR